MILLWRFRFNTFSSRPTVCTHVLLPNLIHWHFYFVRAKYFIIPRNRSVYETRENIYKIRICHRQRPIVRSLAIGARMLLKAGSRRQFTLIAFNWS